MADNKIVDTHNLYIDTSCANKESNSKGDDFQLHLNTQSIDADRGQFIRITLNEFSMYKTWTNVNNNNFEFVVDNNLGGVSKNGITKQNYDTLNELAIEFANQIGSRMVADSTGTATTFSVSDLTPDATTGINGTTDNIISFKITTENPAGTPVAHNFTTFLVQFYEELGDIHALLGGNRIYNSTPSLENSIDVTIGTNDITFTCLYPGQRSTTSHIYLRTSLTTGASETASLSQETNIDQASEMGYSSILARIPINSEFCILEPSHDRVYFLDLHQKHLNNIRFFITDQHNRRLGRRPASASTNTASGSGTQQSTLGNLSFSCVLRVDVVQSYLPKEVQFNRQEPIVNAKKSSSVLLDTRVDRR